MIIMEKKFKVRFMNKNSKKRHKAHFELKRYNKAKEINFF